MSEGPLAIIAGGGSLPGEIARVAAAAGPLVVLRIRGHADRALAQYPGSDISLFDPEGAIRALEQVQARKVVLAGPVHKPGFGALLDGWQAVINRDEIRAIFHGGDDNLLRGVVRFLEARGFVVMGAGDVAPGLMAPSGGLTQVVPTGATKEDIALGRRVLAALGHFDVGQGVVVSAGRVLAVEAAEGTDAMLRRVALLRREGLLARVQRRGRPVLAERSGGVLVKAPKPGQDRRIDMPAIGPRTVDAAVAAGLSGLAIEAGGVLMLERTATLARAEQTGLFIHGFEP